MVHFFGILSPGKRQTGEQQQAFFSDDKPSKLERDAALLAGKAPQQPDRDDLGDRNPELVSARFVSLLSPPFI